MRDFFAHLSKQIDNTQKALNYFIRLFPDARNEMSNVNGVSIAFSADNADANRLITLHSPSRKADLIISGEYDIPEHMVNSVNEKMNPDAQLLELFEIHGEALFESLSGNFNVLIWYPGLQTLKVVNSKLGLYPLYYSIKDGALAVSTRLGAFREIYGTDSTNHAVLMQHCLYNYPVSSSTFLKDVNLLPSASVLTYENDNITILKYWSIEDTFETGANFKTLSQSTALLDEVLDNSIRKKCTGDKKMAISLTGGWDGRLLLSYALQYIKPEQILLYSHGTLDNPDVKLPMATAKRLNYNYVPILLSDPEYEKQQLQWAGDTVKYADGLRQISRLHYMYNMHLLNKDHGIDLILSGIGGSNLLKSTNYKPCDVFNRFVIELIETDNMEQTLRYHYEHCMLNHAALFNHIDFDTYAASFDTVMFGILHGIKDKNKRFVTFLISEIERRYFGAELQSYKHLIKNYSPFFDDAFIGALARTVFVNSERDKGLVKSHYISMLYAKLTSRNNVALSKEPTDRGFSMHEVANPILFPLMLFKYFRHKLVKVKNVDYFNQKDILRKYTDSNFPDLKFHNDGAASNRLFMENYISAMSFITDKN
jgi:asparagine synthetase B (glutamine-hydrolysing)